MRHELEVGPARSKDLVRFEILPEDVAGLQPNRELRLTL